MKITLTFGSLFTKLSNVWIYSWIAEPPKSLKFAELPPASRIASFVAIQRPAELHTMPILPCILAYFISMLNAILSLTVI